MSRILGKSVSLLCVFMVVTAVATVAGAAGLSVELAPVLDKGVLAPEDGAPLRFSVTNESSFTMAILEWQTPLAGFENDLFVVKYDGKRLDYIGPMVARLAPGPGDWLKIAPGETVSAVVDLADGYDLSRPGTYSVRFAFPMQVRELVRPERPWDLDKAAQAGGAGGNRVRTSSNLFTVTTEGVPRPAVRKGKTSYCTSEDLVVILDAQDRGRGFASNADTYLTDLPVASRPTDVLYNTWFGEYDATRYATVNTTYDTTYTVMGEDYSYLCAKCGRGFIAYVYQDRPYEVWICPDFFSIDETFQGGAILHETVHWFIVAGAEDYVYGESGCMDLAETDPDSAIENADNLRLFAEYAPVP